MPRIILTESANRDLDEIWDYIAVENHSPIAADQLIDEFDSRFRLLVTQPMMGESVEKLRPNTRRMIVKKRFLVFYEPTEAGILILRVLHGARLIRPDDISG
jgi:toxin ParE1/3/4